MRWLTVVALVVTVLVSALGSFRGAAVRSIGYVAIGAAVVAAALALVTSRRPVPVAAKL